MVKLDTAFHTDYAIRFSRYGGAYHGSSTMTPQQPLEDGPICGLVEFVPLKTKPASHEVKQGDVLTTKGETTKAALAATGFVLRLTAPVQYAH
jgi:hypothetical protein